MAPELRRRHLQGAEALLDLATRGRAGLVQLPAPRPARDSITDGRELLLSPRCDDMRALCKLSAPRNQGTKAREQEQENRRGRGR